jgi:NitT/TauT family transport system substrate-binding protein
MTRSLAPWAAACAAFVALAAPARAEVSEIRITKQPSIIYLPVVIMEQQKLIEKHAKAAGLDLKANWLTFTSGGASTDALLSGNVDLVTSGATNMLLLWSRTGGQVKGVSAVAGLPMLLVTRNPDVKTLKDFTEKDKIAVPTIKVSTQATILHIAAEQQLGPGGAERLDKFTVQMGHPDAFTQLMNPNLEVDAHFSAPPYQYQALKNPANHVVLDSAEVMGGPVSNAVTFGMVKFYEANPKAVRAFLAALDEATALIDKDKKAAVQVYLEATKESYTPDELVEWISKPNSVFGPTPTGTMKFAEYMAKTGLIKAAPKSWKDIFFPTVHELPGS